MNSTNPYTPPATSSNLSSDRPRRPVFVTVICVLLILGGGAALASYNSIYDRSIASWYPPYNAVYVLIQFICVFGLWTMRRWAFVALVGLVTLNIIVHFAIGEGNFVSIAIWLVLFYFLIRHIPSKKQQTEQVAAPDG